MPNSPLPAAAGQDLAAAVEAVVLSLTAEICGREPGSVQPHRRYHDLGFDSVQYVELSGLLGEHYGLELAPTLFFEAQTPHDVATLLLQRHAATLGARHAALQAGGPATLATPLPVGPSQAPAPAAGQAAAEGDIAIVGMAARLPQSADLAVFWQHLLAGDDLVSEVPAGRWDWRRPDTGPATRWGGFVPDIDRFDAAFFGISPREAEQMDPQQRLLLQTAWAALEDAAIRPADLAGSDTAVFVGASTCDYLSLLPEADAHLAIGIAHAMLPNRLSYLLDLHGPSEAVDTACSSSLVALHRAVRALRRGESRLALVGGVNALLTPQLHRALGQAGMLSPQGRCRTFDAEADGYVRGEGVAVLVLKPLADALADGNPVHAIVKGSAINHGGRAASLTAPDIRAQAALLAAAYRDAGVHPATVSYVEAHGTGTPLGDPVEVQALQEGFGAFDAAGRQGQQPPALRCGLGSVKSNIGHLEAAAGLAGVLKVVLAMRHRVLPPSLHCRQLNPYLKLDDGRYFVVDRAQPWPAAALGLPLRAGVSSFGFGGANAHVVLEAAEPPALAPAAAGSEAPPQLVLLSARTEADLQARLRQLAAWIDTAPAGDRLLPALAHTLRRGREAMAARCAVLCRSMAALRDLLGQALREGLQQRFLHDPAVPPADALAEAGRAWVGGSELPADTAPAGLPMLSLPGYPFHGERYWPAGAQPGDGCLPVLQPAGPGRHVVQLEAAMPLLADHALAGVPVLAAAAQIDFVLAAAGAADRLPVVLREVEWLAPLAVGPQGLALVLQMAAAGAGAQTFSFHSEEQPQQAASRGAWSQSASSAAPVLVDMAALRARCRRRLAAEACYEAFSGLGIDYGPGFRALRELRVGDREVLAELQPVPGLAACASGVLPPALLDAALQAIIGLQLASPDGAAQRRLPARLASIEVLAPAAAPLWAWVREVAGPAGPCYDIDLLEPNGRPAAQLRGLVLATGPRVAQPEPVPAAEPADTLALPPGEHRLVRQWSPLPEPARPAPILPLTVWGGTPAQHAALAAGGTALRTVATLEQIDAATEHLVWLLPEAPEADTTAPALPDATAAVLAGFRLVQRLLALGFGDRPLCLSALTVRQWALPGESPAFPAQAGLAGLLGSLAKEMPHWTVRLLDLPAATALPPEWQRRPADGCQRPLLWRHGQWLAPQLVPLQPPAVPPQPAYRAGAVYLVIGGAGGIGRVWTEHVLRQQPAQVVWVGRRAEDAGITAERERLGCLGPRPDYLAADATRPGELQRVREEVLARHGRIDGLVHAAIVLQDGSLAQLDEARFMLPLQAQVDSLRHLAESFGGLALDFVLLFSSLQSSVAAAGQANYAAGCTFKDGFAGWLASRLQTAVKVINWGYWGHTGVVASEAYRQRMAAAGHDSIRPAEAMAALDALMDGPLQQMAYLRTLAPLTLPGLALGLSAWRPAMPSPLPRLAAVPAPGEPGLDAWLQATDRLEAALAQRLYAELAALGGFGDDAHFDLEALVARIGLLSSYRPWLVHSLAQLASHGWLAWDGHAGRLLRPPPGLDAARDEWAQQRAALHEAGHAAHVALAELVLPALPAVLQGRLPATGLLFPEGRMDAVEAVYRGNLQADACNRQLVAVVDALLQRLDDGGPVRLLEIGGGTGGTTVPLLAALQGHRGRLASYDFTDISPAFLRHAERGFGRGEPLLHTRLFDVSRPLASQDVPAGAYDLVVATNVLHATPDIAQTLRNAKALLKPGGHLLINELLQVRLFTHLTFGLLDGWWLHADSPRRLPGSPLLSREGWRAALAEAGFVVLPQAGGDDDRLGQGVIVAVSDGCITQPAAVRPPAAALPAATALPVPAQPAADLRQRCLQWLAALVGRTLKLPPQRLDPQEPLGSYGVDSILVIGLTKALREALGVPLPNATLFEHRSLAALADHLLASHREACERLLPPPAIAAQVGAADPDGDAAAGGRQPSSAPARATAPAVAAARGATPAVAAAAPRPGAAFDVAVVGLSGRFAQCGDLQAFWELLRAGRHGITEVPAERWDWRPHFDAEKGRPGKTYSRWGGFLPRIDTFDAPFFRIPPREAEAMDPQARLFLEEAWAAIEDAGHTPASLSPRRRVGVFVGVMNGYYPSGAQFWSVANRVSYLLDFQGPSLAVDTACSSSLTALHLALESLAAGSCDCAIAGGVNLVVSPRHTIGLASLTMLSAGDRCRAFGDGADGFVDGEGVGAVVLKPLARALADGDAIYGVIKGSMINAGGRTHGYTVPNPQAQQAVVSEALARAGLPARAVSYLEAHGTGTALGDPIEVAGLTRAFREGTADTGFCALGSVKSNIGHCESAAGMAGLAKVLLQMQHGELVPTLHAEPPNTDIDFTGSPFVLQQRLQPWLGAARPEGGRWPRIAGLSSFGAGGANAHVVIEEFVDPPAELAADAGQPALVVLSAATEEALAGRAAQLLAALQAGRVAPHRLADLAYTLQVGREPMARRAACLAATLPALADQLQRFVDGDRSAWHQGQAGGLAELESDAELRAAVIERCLAGGKHDKLLALWCQGLSVDWSRLHQGRRRQRLHLPSYPFAKLSYWLADDAAVPGRAASPAPALPASPAVPGAAADGPAALLQTLVADLLGYPTVAMEQSFLALGGDSIRAARLQRRLQEALAIEVPMSRLLEAPSLAALAEWLEDGRARTAPAADAAMSAPAGREGLLSTQQQQFHFLDRMSPGNPAFNLPGALRVHGPLDLGRVERAYQAMVEAHDVLRTRFVVRDGQARAEVLPLSSAAVERIDLAPLLPRRQAARLAECLAAAGRQPFDLEQGGLSRLTVVSLGDEDHVLLLNLHHIVGDAGSVAQLLKALAEAGLSPTPVPVRRPARQYADWAADEQRELPAVLARELPYWRERLQDLPGPLPLPTDRARPPLPSYRGHSVPLALPAPLLQRLDDYCKARNLSSFVVLLAAFKVMLRCLSGCGDVVVGSPYANRAGEDTREMVGCLAYALVLRTRLGSGGDFDQAVAQVRETVYGAFDHLGVPFPRLVEALQPRRHGHANPLYQVMFNLIPMPPLPAGVSQVEVDTGHADYDLFLRIYHGQGRAEGVLQYSADLFDAGTAEEIATFYGELLHLLLEHPTLPLDSLAAPDTLAGRTPVQPQADAQPLAVHVASTFTDRPLAATLRYWGQVTGRAIEPEFAGYNQLLQTLYDASHPFHANRHGLNVVLVRAQDWLRHGAVPAGGAAARVEAGYDELAEAVQAALPGLSVPLLLLVLPSDAAACGIDADTALAQYRRWQAGLGESARLAVRYWEDIAAVYPAAEVFDPHADAAGHVPYTGEYFAAVGSYIARFAFQHSDDPLDGIWDCAAADVHAEADQLALAGARPQAGAPRAAPVSPRNADEQALLEIFGQALKQDDIGIDDGFFALGGHSLLAIALVYRINERFGSRLTVADVFMAPTVRQLAERLHGEAVADEPVDLAQAAVLPDDVQPLPGAAPAPEAGAILLTGATGFVGRFLLRELLDRTDATVHCLVRARDAGHGAQRLREVMQRWSLWRDTDAARIVAEPGDLAQPWLGLGEDRYRTLCREVDVVYHNGTSMNHLESFEMARSANVDGVVALLRLACSDRPKTFNYVSTLGIFSPEGRSGRHVFDEASPIDAERHLAAQGYTTSKWVGEQLVHLAARRGVPCKVFRLGLVTGDSEAGRYDELQSFYRLLKSCLLMGSAFDNFRYDLVITPVDYVARALAHLGLRRPADSEVFHLSTMQVTPMPEVFHLINRLTETPLQLGRHAEWIQALRSRYEQGEVLPIVPVVQWMMTKDEAGLARLAREREAVTLVYDCSRTHAELQAAGIELPPFTEALFRRYLEGMLAMDPELRASGRLVLKPLAEGGSAPAGASLPDASFPAPTHGQSLPHV
ncbi:thioester reductase domain-containing protein [Eleftheria terrae]|uniref:thioester reductase domain-containing protein n=1 Tax=Eleftheria terrae TaxID=1597781 RepID=UPI00263B756D|nr:thioester reductase domain-containing protein [Eleftheria terrae]WKB55884.1 thioester reductase domain-containing protein [Eleftheria terrae]